MVPSLMTLLVGLECPLGGLRDRLCLSQSRFDAESTACSREAQATKLQRRPRQTTSHTREMHTEGETKT
jgi:hypothetical protein